MVAQEREIFHSDMPHLDTKNYKYYVAKIVEGHLEKLSSSHNNGELTQQLDDIIIDHIVLGRRISEDKLNVSERMWFDVADTVLLTLGQETNVTCELARQKHIEWQQSSLWLTFT